MTHSHRCQLVRLSPSPTCPAPSSTAPLFAKPGGQKWKPLRCENLSHAKRWGFFLRASPCHHDAAGGSSPRSAPWDPSWNPHLGDPPPLPQGGGGVPQSSGPTPSGCHLGSFPVIPDPGVYPQHDSSLATPGPVTNPPRPNPCTLQRPAA